MVKEKNKSFLPDTFIGWLTIATLVIGLSASLVSHLYKPYVHIIDIEKRLVRMEDKICDMNKSIDRIYRQVK